VTDDGIAAAPAGWRRLRGGLLIGLGFLGLAAFVGTGALTIAVTPSYSRVGPGVFPAVIAAGLVVLGLAMITQTLAGRWSTDWDRADGRDAALRRRGRAALACVAAGLLLDLLLMEWAGFVIASAVLFAATAWAFGHRRPLQALVLGLVLGAAIFAVFAYGLQVRLPSGSLWSLL
jgi:putative tricarboxylic transport membrane protein